MFGPDEMVAETAANLRRAAVELELIRDLGAGVVATKGDLTAHRRILGESISRAWNCWRLAKDGLGIIDDELRRRLDTGPVRGPKPPRPKVI